MFGLPTRIRPVGIPAAWLCAGLLALLVAASHPVAEMAMNDDWSYIWSARVLADTGHVVYNGWATAMLTWQLYWGALFLKLFGFSFLVSRVSMLVLSMLTVVLMHRLLRRCGVSEALSTVGTFTLMLSPLFFPLAFSFMSDIPGLLAILCCFYGTVRALQAATDRATLAWLAVAALSNLFLGSVRQIAWLGVLLVLPCAAWLLRRRPRIVAAAAGLWLASAVVIAISMRWFAHQPFILREPLLVVPLNRQTVPLIFGAVPRAVLSILLYSLPVALMLALRLPLRRRGVRLTFALGMLAILLPLGWVTLRHLPNAWLAPFTYDSLGVPGFQDFVMLPGTRPVLLSNPLRALLTILTLAVLLSMTIVWRAVPATRAAIHPASQARRIAITPYEDAATVLQGREMLILFGPYTGAYLLLYVTRAFQWDRYLLPIAFLAVMLALRAFQSRFGMRPPRWVMIPVLLLAAFDVAANHDVYALYRARLAAAATLQQAGLPRTRFSAGFEYDAWTELQQTGYVKDPRLILPAGLQLPRPPAASRQLTWSARLTPSVDPVYAVAFSLSPSLAPTTFPAVPYRTWLPPRQHELLIGRVR